MNGAKAFFDTNVLLYMYGGDEGKQARAERALSAIYWGWPYVTEHTGGSGVLRG
jgi:predicted nucleic acid-binding protein